VTKTMPQPPTAPLRAPRRRRRARRVARREEGAVLFIVMLVLLTATALAVFAVRSTSDEIRASGYYRMDLQSQQVGESGLLAAMAWVDYRGPDALTDAMARSQDAGYNVDLEPFERPLAPGKPGYRLYSTDLQVEGRPLVDRETLGQRQPYEPLILVDVYDSHEFPGVVTGYRSDGFGRLRFLGATYTSRGRVRIPGDTPVAGDTRPYHEGANDARARGVSGPF